MVYSWDQLWLDVPLMLPQEDKSINSFMIQTSFWGLVLHKMQFIEIKDLMIEIKICSQNLKVVF